MHCFQDLRREAGIRSKAPADEHIRRFLNPAAEADVRTLISRLDSVVVVPLSTQPGEIWPLRVKVNTGGRKPGFAIVPGIRQAAKSRLLEPIAILSPAELKRLDEAVAAYLSD